MLNCAKKIISRYFNSCNISAKTIIDTRKHTLVFITVARTPNSLTYSTDLPEFKSLQKLAHVIYIDFLAVKIKKKMFNILAQIVS